MLEVKRIWITKSELKDFVVTDPKELSIRYKRQYVNRIYQSLNGKLPPMVLSKEEVIILLQKQLQEVITTRKIKILTLEDNETFK